MQWARLAKGDAWAQRGVGAGHDHLVQCNRGTRRCHAFPNWRMVARTRIPSLMSSSTARSLSSY